MKIKTQLDLSYNRTKRAPSKDDRPSALSRIKERRDARTAAREAFLAQPLPALPIPEEIGVPPQPLRPESVAAARAARRPAQSLPEALTDLVNRQSFHGSWLPLRIGMADGPWFSEKAILLAERVGWIKRGNYDPRASREFMVFGLGGFSGDGLPKLGKVDRLDVEHRNALCFHWITVTTKWLESDFVREMLRGGGVL